MIGSEVTVVLPEYDSSEEENKESNQTSTQFGTKRLKKADKQWKLEKVYEDRSSAEQDILREGTWSYSFKNKLVDGDVNIYYRCNKVKFRGEQCQASIYLHYPADSQNVNLYRSQLSHNCHDILEKARPRISVDVKQEIRKLVDFDSRIKPKAVLERLSQKGMEVPKKTLVNNYLAFLRKKKLGSSTISLGELERILIEKSKIPTNDTDAFVAAYVIEYEEPTFFRFFVSSKTLLALARNVKHIHADATYKLVWQGFPVLVVGTTDRNRQFHCFGIAVCVNEKTEDFEFLFSSLQKGVNKIFNEVMSPQILISDASESIHNGFKKVFGGNSTIIMCWAHMKRNVQKKAEQLVKPKEHIRDILSDLDKLQLCHTEDIFKKASECFLEKWVVQKQFVSYFRKQWLEINRNWYEGSGFLIPSTNNALESWNRVIKDENTLRERLPISHFLQHLFNYVSTWSNHYVSSIKIFHTEPEITLQLWTAGYQWAKANHNIFSSTTGDRTVYSIMQAERNSNFETFDQFKEMYFTNWLTKLPIEKEKWKDGTCDCPSFLKQLFCKHIVGIAIRLKHAVPPPEAKTIPIGNKRKRGRPVKAKKALIVQ